MFSEEFSKEACIEGFIKGGKFIAVFNERTERFFEGRIRERVCELDVSVHWRRDD